MKEGLLEKLACPKCHVHVLKRENCLLCPICQQRFAMKDDIPIMFHEEQKKETELDLQKDEETKDIKILYGKKFSFIKLFKKYLYWIFYYDAPAKRKIAEFNKKYLSSGDESILEIGGGPIRLYEKSITLNIGAFEEVDVVGDAHWSPFMNNSFDCVICDSLMEHVRDPQRIIAEVYRILKPDGIIYATVPFISHFHGWPRDYQRFTLMGVKYLFRDFKELELNIFGGPTLALIELGLNYIILLFYSQKFKFILFPVALFLSLFFVIFVPFLKFIDYFLVKIKESHRLTLSFIYVGKKL